jgi:arylsulfatase A-like enzyme
MAAPNILVVAIDGLRASALGAYGNTTFPTPNLDKFAAGSVLFDWCFAPTSDLKINYRALSQSICPLRGEDFPATESSLIRQATAYGVHTTLVTDEAHFNPLMPAEDFNQCVQIASNRSWRPTAVSDTSLARLLITACKAIEAAKVGPQLVWVHARGMYGPWDAPLELQQRLLEGEDHSPMVSLAPPDFRVTENDDPDTAFRCGTAYAAQVMVLDNCWEAIMEAVRGRTDDPWLIVLMGVRGFPLGEHGRIGGADHRLYVEQMHVPWLIQFPDGQGGLERCGDLVSLLDLFPTLADWMRGCEVTSGQPFDGNSVTSFLQGGIASSRDALILGSSSANCGIRTPEWSFRFSRSGDVDIRELFVKPDDRWEANDIAALCPDVVEELTARLESALTEFQAGKAMGATGPLEVSRLRR